MRTKGIALLITGIVLLAASFTAAYWEQMHALSGMYSLGLWCFFVAALTGVSGAAAIGFGVCASLFPEKFTA